MKEVAPEVEELKKIIEEKIKLTKEHLLEIQNNNEQIINDFVSHVEVAEFGAYAGDIYGKIRDTISAKGIVVDHADLLIAAHAISLDIVLVTNNIRDFKAIPNIKLENWLD